MCTRISDDRLIWQTDGLGGNILQSIHPSVQLLRLHIPQCIINFITNTRIMEIGLPEMHQKRVRERERDRQKDRNIA